MARILLEASYLHSKTPLPWKDCMPLIIWALILCRDEPSHNSSSCWIRFTITATLASRAREAINTLFCPSREKFYTVVLKGVRKISDAL